MKKKTTYILILIFIYFTVSYIGILNHEFFIDEAHHWLLARDSNSISQLIQNTRIEGHPLLWTFMLYGISRFTPDPFWMQFLHIIISSSVVFLFLKKAPFNWLFKTLFIFGYFMIFEYNLISRNYSLGILFLFLACSIFKNRDHKFSLICTYLALASNSHLIFSVLAFAMFLTLLVEQSQNETFIDRKYIKGYFIFSMGLVLIYIQIHYTDSGWLLDPINKLPIKERLVNGFASFFKGIIAIPDFRTMHFWNSNLIVNLNKPTASVCALLIYLMPLLLFFKNRKTLFFVYTALVGAQVFFFITQRAATRFHGITYILIIIALWLEKYYNYEDYKLKYSLSSLKLTFFQKPIIYIILTIQFCSGIYAYSMDIKFPFSSAKKTINYIKSSDYSKTEVITVTCDGTLLSAYLEKKIYFLCDANLQSYCRWNQGCVGKITDKQLVSLVTEYMVVHNKNILFVSYYSLSNKRNIEEWTNLNDIIKVRFVKKFNENIVEKTNYYIFEIAKIKY